MKSVPEVATMMGVSVGYVRRLCQQGFMRALRVGRDWVILDETLEQMREFHDQRKLTLKKMAKAKKKYVYVDRVTKKLQVFTEDKTPQFEADQQQLEAEIEAEAKRQVLAEFKRQHREIIRERNRALREQQEKIRLQEIQREEELRAKYALELSGGIPRADLSTPEQKKIIEEIALTTPESELDLSEDLVGKYEDLLTDTDIVDYPEAQEEKK